MTAGWGRSPAVRLPGATVGPRVFAEMEWSHLKLEDVVALLVNSLQRRLVRVATRRKQNGVDHRGWTCDGRVRRTV